MGDLQNVLEIVVPENQLNIRGKKKKVIKFFSVVHLKLLISWHLSEMH